MRVLLINKFLEPRGGSETYVFRLGRELERQGHEVQYFGMDSENRQVGNRAEAYAPPVDFHRGGLLRQAALAPGTIYSRQARKKLGQVLAEFQPQVCHINNFHHQLTPSILLEIRQWRRRTGRKCRVIYTAHDFQLVCPNHLCRDLLRQENCQNCLAGRYGSCIRRRCIHGSFSRSLLGTFGAWLWRRAGIYRELDAIVCCSHFLKSKLDTDPVLAEKTLVLPNFVEPAAPGEKKGYVLYFGRYVREKGVATLAEAAKVLPQIPFVFAGAGPLETALEGVPNIRNVGFQTGERLARLIREADLTVCPSEYYENCPFSILESMAAGTAVLGADIGGNPELIQNGITGELFESGNLGDLTRKLKLLWEDPERLREYGRNCRRAELLSPEEYVHRLMALYQGEDYETKKAYIQAAVGAAVCSAAVAESAGEPSAAAAVSG